ncbi:hypothetical protein llap_21398 [Limosa lapponica baueri]|uniref:Uncharacterized protein n=1 Tax=Limosa lapponica baueri TaxID=1758121 RepID=A0A2I0T3E3_LIMLA|nr:hypothetical protein llap_21398 [Limosa lapponica baueri]
MGSSGSKKAKVKQRVNWREATGHRLFAYKDNGLTMEPSKEYLFEYKGFNFVTNTTPEYVASLEDFEIKDSDIFLATYPKSEFSSVLHDHPVSSPAVINLRYPPILLLNLYHSTEKSSRLIMPSRARQSAEL